jgi:hypothetical protein
MAPERVLKTLTSQLYILMVETRSLPPYRACFMQVIWPNLSFLPRKSCNRKLSENWSAMLKSFQITIFITHKDGDGGRK